MLQMSDLSFSDNLERNPVSKVDHPSHYNQIPGIECIDVVENFNFNIGNAIKYLWRAGLKDDAIEDLKKAAWYCQRELDRIQKRSESIP